MKIALDTNIFIAIMNQEPDSEYCEQIITAVEKAQIKAILSTIVVAEILVGFNQKQDEKGKQRILDKISLQYQIVPVSLEIAEKSAAIRASTNIKLPDAIIYATALASEAEVLISKDGPLIKRGKIAIMNPKEFLKEYM